MVRVVALVAVFAVVAAGAWFLLADDGSPSFDVGAVDVVAPDVPDTIAGAPVAPVAEREATPDAQRLDVAPDESAAAQVPQDADVAYVVGQVVFDATVLPVVGAEVVAHLAGVERGEQPRATTDAAGRYEVVVPLDGDAKLERVEVVAGRDHPQHLFTKRADLTPGARVTVDLRLPPVITARGVVVDLADDPVPGATVRGWSLRTYRVGTAAPSGEVTTDALGRFEFPGLAPTFTLEAEAPGLVAHERIESTRTRAGDVDGLTLRVSRPRRIDGRVVDAGGRGVAGAEVRAFVSGVGGLTQLVDVIANGPGSVTETTDTDGNFTLRGVAERTVSVVVTTEGFPEWRGQHEPGDAGMLIRLATGGALSGLVLRSDGAPAVGARVGFAKGPYNFRQRETKVGDDGRFSLLGLPETDEGVVDVLAEGQAVHVVQGVTVSSQVDALPLEIMLSREEVITGVVVDVDGAPVPGANVSIVGDREIDLGGGTMIPKPTWERRVADDTMRADDEGRFAFDNLYRGSFVLRAVHPDDNALVITQKVDASARDLRVVLDPLAGGGVVLRGRVTDAFTGLPVTEFRVTPMAKQGEGGYGGSGTVFRKADGSYTIPGLEPAEMIVTVSADGYAPFSLPPREYEAGEHVIDAALSPERELWLRIVDERGTPLKGTLMFSDDAGKSLSVEISPNSSSNFMHTNEEGEAIVRGIPAQPISVRAQADGFGGPTTVTFDVTQPISGWQDIVVREAVEQDVLVVVLRRGPQAAGAVQLLPESASVTDRLVEIVTKLADGELASPSGIVNVFLTDASGAPLGIAPLEDAATAAVLADPSLVDDPIAVQVRVPAGSNTIRVEGAQGGASTTWEVTEGTAVDLGLVVFVL